MSDNGTVLPSVAGADVPWLSVSEMRAIDAVMVDELGIELKQMMENAGRNLATLVRILLGGSAADRSVTVLAGAGGNGGGGLVTARHLRGAGASVRVALATERGRLAPVTCHQLRILDRLEVPVEQGATAVIGSPDLVVDALLGYSQTGQPRGPAADLISAAAGQRVLSLDVPSGLELETGTLHAPCIRAEATMTLAAPKAGLAGLAAAAVGDLYLADISVPSEAFTRIGRDAPPPFADGPLVRVLGPGTT
jgi:NAD(P)H-hydrate epimerase